MQIIAKQLVRQIRFPGLSGLCGRTEWLPVTAVIALGTALRIWSPAMRSDLWYDEAYSLTVARQSFARMTHLLLVGGDTNPPLYTVLLHFWLKLGGSDVHVKLFSLLFGVASIPALYFLAKLVAGRGAGLLSCSLLATSESAIIYSVEARPYALFLLLSILSTYLLLLAINLLSQQAARYVTSGGRGGAASCAELPHPPQIKRRRA